MFRVTRLADYGIIMLTRFAGSPGTVLKARDMARAVDLPLPVVSKILKLLAREGLLASHRGIKGGYSLARDPGAITVAAMIRALDGPIAVTKCTDRLRGGCTREGGCPVRTNWHRINAAIHEALDKITLSQMTQPLPQALVQVHWTAHGQAVQAP